MEKTPKNAKKNIFALLAPSHQAITMILIDIIPLQNIKML